MDHKVSVSDTKFRVLYPPNGHRLQNSKACRARAELCRCGVCAGCVLLEQIENARFLRHVDPNYYKRRAMAWRSTLSGDVAAITPRRKIVRPPE